MLGGVCKWCTASRFTRAGRAPLVQTSGCFEAGQLHPLHFSRGGVAVEQGDRACCSQRLGLCGRGSWRMSSDEHTCHLHPPSGATRRGTCLLIMPHGGCRRVGLWNGSIVLVCSPQRLRVCIKVLISVFYVEALGHLDPASGDCSLWIATVCEGTTCRVMQLCAVMVASPGVER